MIKKQKSEDNIEINVAESQREEVNNKVIVRIKDEVTPFIPQNLVA